MEILVLTASEVRDIATPQVAFDAMRVAFGQLSSGAANVPLRGRLPSLRGTTYTMPAYLSDSNALGAKIVSVFHANAEHGRPVVQGAVLLLDGDSGAATALLDGTELTALRTAAGSALATRLLLEGAPSTLLVFGAGAQARAHVRTLVALFPIEAVGVVSRSAASARLLCEWCDRELAGSLPAGRSPHCEVAGDPALAVEDADIVVTATSSSIPLFGGASLSQGAHVNAVGAHRADARELDTETIRRARVVADQRSAVWEEAGELILPRQEGAITSDHIDAELGELVNGTAPSGACGREVTVFKSVGNAAQDVALAHAVVAIARERGIGRTVPF